MIRIGKTGNGRKVLALRIDASHGGTQGVYLAAIIPLRTIAALPAWIALGVAAAYLTS